MAAISTDLLPALRSLLRRRAFLALAASTLALGVGASSAIFAVAESVLLRRLPFTEAERLYTVLGVWGPESEVRGASYAEIADWRRLTRSFVDIAVYDETTANLAGHGDARQLEVERVSASYFDLLGVRPALGRTFAAAEDVPGAVAGAVISDGLWHSVFGGDPAVLGRAVRLDNVQFRIVGVMPPGFSGVSFDTDV